MKRVELASPTRSPRQGCITPVSASHARGSHLVAGSGARENHAPTGNSSWEGNDTDVWYSIHIVRVGILLFAAASPPNAHPSNGPTRLRSRAFREARWRLLMAYLTLSCSLDWIALYRCCQLSYLDMIVINTYLLISEMKAVLTASVTVTEGSCWTTGGSHTRS